MAHENYKNMMKDLTQIMGNGELDSNQLTQICKSIFKKDFNSVCSWSEYVANPKKPYSIVNTDATVGSHCLVYIQKMVKLYMFMILSQEI